MKIKSLGIIVLLVIGFFIVNVSVSEPSGILVVPGGVLAAAAPGGGGTPAPSGDCPCYYVGQVVSQGGWWQSGNYYYITEIFIGNCTIKQIWEKNGQYLQTTYYDGGCTCQCTEG